MAILTVEIPSREFAIHQIQEQNNAYDPTDDTYATAGYPNFSTWPVWNDITHQSMWVDWIKRSYTGGLRVMVALAVNSSLLATLSQSSTFPTDDKNSADLQIQQTIAFVNRHSDFMQIAYSSADIKNIVNANKLAVVLGVEIDNIGDWTVTGTQPTSAQIQAEIDRLYTEGVRYAFPIHLTDNAFGGTALYVSVMPLQNTYEEGAYQMPMCSQPGDNINYVFGFSASGLAQYAVQQLTNFNLFNSIPPNPSPCPTVNGHPTGHVNTRGLTPLGVVAIQEMMHKGMLIDIDHMSQLATNSTLALAEQVPGGYPLNSGHNGSRCDPLTAGCNSNERSLTAAQYARIFNLHGMAGVGSANLDASQWTQSYNKVLNAMGVSSSGANAVTAGAGFGTDADGLSPGMPPSTKTFASVKVHSAGYDTCYKKAYNPADHTCQSGDMSPSQYKDCVSSANAAQSQAEATCLSQYPDILQSECTSNCSDGLPAVVYGSSFPMSTTGNKSWDYNVVGVAHYGMLPDFLQAARNAPGGANVIANLMNGADYFYQTWDIAEARCSELTNGANCGSPLSVDTSKYYKLVARHSGKVLDVRGGVTSDGAAIQQWDDNSGTNQQWQFVSQADGAYTIVSRNSGKVIDMPSGNDVNGVLMQQYTANGGGNQEWTVVPVGGGYVEIHTAIPNFLPRVFDVQGGPTATANGVPVQLYDYVGGANQQWSLVAGDPVPMSPCPNNGICCGRLDPHGECDGQCVAVTASCSGVTGYQCASNQKCCGSVDSHGNCGGECVASNGSCSPQPPPSQCATGQVYNAACNTCLPTGQTCPTVCQAGLTYKCGKCMKPTESCQ